MSYAKKTVKAPWNTMEGKMVTTFNKDGKAIEQVSMNSLKVNTLVSIGVKNPVRPNGLEYIPAWILKKAGPDMYQVTFGRASKRQPAVMSISALHAGALCTFNGRAI